MRRSMLMLRVMGKLMTNRVEHRITLSDKGRCLYATLRWARERKEVCTVAHCARRAKDFSTARLNNCVQSPSVWDLAEQSAAEIKLSACHCECAEDNSAGKHSCGNVFLCSSRSDREALVHHRAIGHQKPHRVIFTFFCVSGRVFRSEDWEQNNVHRLVDDKLEFVPLCQLVPSLQVGILINAWRRCLCRRTCSRCHSWALCKSGCSTVATVLAPLAVVCFKNNVVDQCSRSADVVTCCHCGPSVRRSHSLTLSSVTPSDWSACRYQSSHRCRSRISLFFFLFIVLLWCPHALWYNFEVFAATIFFLWNFGFCKWMRLSWTYWNNSWRSWELVSSPSHLLQEVQVHICNVCVPENCNTPWLFSVSDHEKFMSFEIALFLNDVFCNLRNILALLVVVLWKYWCYPCASVCVLRNILHVFGDQYKKFVLCHCYHVAGFSVLVPNKDFLPFHLNWMGV